MVQITPMTMAMEAYYWLEEKTKNCNVFEGESMNMDSIIKLEGLKWFCESIEEEEFEGQIQNPLLYYCNKLIEKSE